MTKTLSAAEVAAARNQLIIDPRITKPAERAASQIARAERLDTISAKEIYRTILAMTVDALCTTDAAHRKEIEELRAWKDEVAPAYERLVVEREEQHSKVERLQAELAKYAVQEDFDFPADVPESCGFHCDFCNAYEDTREAVQHAKTCPLHAPKEAL